MKLLSKVVWQEGMYLGPHHFQAQARYFEDNIHFGISSLWFEPYGFVGYKLNEDALRNGTVSLIHARGTFPDGLPFQMPESDPLPQPLSIAELFPPTSEHLTILLAVAPYRAGGVNCSLNGGGATQSARYTAETHSLQDENTGSDEKKVRLARKNVRLLAASEGAESVETLPLARVMRDGSGHFILDPNFIPPCVRIDASQSLMALTSRLIEAIEEKGAAISGMRRSSASSAAGFSAQEVGIYWFLHSINTALPTLRHLYASKRGHPEELYTTLAQLAGALCTFSLDSHPRDLPLYDHLNLEKCMREMDRQIRRDLERFLPTAYISIALKPAGKYFWEGDVTDQRCLDRAQWILGIHSEIGEVELISRTPQLVKLCSAQFVPELVKRALPGLGLRHLESPPAGIAPKVESQYFSVTRSGPCWDHIVKTRRVGAYVPGDIPSPEIELNILLEAKD